MVNISLRGISGYGNHGVYQAERDEGQIFIADIDIWIPEPVDDDVSTTADYSHIAAQVVELIESDPVNLIETLAARIADRILNDLETGSVRVCVHKPQAPIAVHFDDVSVTVMRRK